MRSKQLSKNDSLEEKDKEMLVDVVLAWYREDISWLPAFLYDLPLESVRELQLRIHVYMKSGEPLPQGVSRQFQNICEDYPGRVQAIFTRLPNVGREGHTYVSHILSVLCPADGASGLPIPDRTIFLQGDPLDHVDLSSIAKVILDPRSLSQSFVPLGKQTFTIENMSCPFWRHRPEFDVLMRSVYDQLFKADAKPFSFCRGGVFCAGTAAVLRRPRAFWEACLGMLDHSVDPLEGHVFERFWGLIFQPGPRPPPF